MDGGSWMTEIATAVGALVAAFASVATLWLAIRGLRERRRKDDADRLRFRCVRWTPNGLFLIIDFRPENLNHGIEAQIVVRSPPEAVVAPVKTGVGDGQGGFIPPPFTSLDGGSQMRKTRLTVNHRDVPSGFVRGTTLVAVPPSGEISTAKVTVRVIDTSSQRRLMARTIRISPIN